MLSELRDEKRSKEWLLYSRRNGLIFGYAIIRSKIWLYTITVGKVAIAFKTKQSNLLSCDFTVENMTAHIKTVESLTIVFKTRMVENMAMRRYGRIFGDASRDENGEYDGD